MPCDLTVYDADAKAKKTYTCDDANTDRVIIDDHAAGGVGEYTDVSGQAFSVDWTKLRLIGFARRD